MRTTSAATVRQIARPVGGDLFRAFFDDDVPVGFRAFDGVRPVRTTPPPDAEPA